MGAAAREGARVTLQRKTPLARTQFKRAEPKPQKGPKQRRCALKSCRAEFLPSRPLQRACGPLCAELLVAEAKAKARAKAEKAERAEVKRRKEAAKDRGDWLKEAQKAFNAFIRERDKNQPCICCGRTETSVSGLHAHGWDCGHYRSTGSAPHLRFHEDNAHRQLVYCNRHGAGRAVDYRVGLIARIGLERVEALEADQTPRKYSIEELRAIRDEYRTRLRQLK